MADTINSSPNSTRNKLAKINLVDIGGRCIIKGVFAMADKYKGV